MKMKTEVKDHHQVILRFVSTLALLIGLLLLGVWRKGLLYAEQKELADVGAQVSEMNRALGRTVGRVLDARNEVEHSSANGTAALDRRRLADDLGTESARLRAALADLKDANSGVEDGPRHRLGQWLFQSPARRNEHLTRFLDEAERLRKAIVADGDMLSTQLATLLSTSARRLRADSAELGPALESAQAQFQIDAQARLDEVERLTAAAVVLVILFFAGMGSYIIFPTKRLLKAQAENHDEAMRSLRERNVELAESKERLATQTRIFQSVLESVGEAVVVFHEDGRLRLQNRAADALFGPGEPGTPMLSWKRLAGFCNAATGEPISTETSPLAAALRGDTVQGELLLVKNNRKPEPVYVLGSAYPMTDETGGAFGVVLSYHDISERVKDEMQLERAKVQAEAASRAKSEFLANISHEIRTPMTAILGYADMLVRPSISSEAQSRNVQVIRRNGRMLVRLIDDLLDLSKIEAGRLEVEKRPLSLGEIVAEVYSLLHTRAEEKNIVFCVEFEGALPKIIYTDATRLRQVLINIVGNAIKFTESGEVKLTMRYRPGDRAPLEFVVSDTGCGLPEEGISKLFSPFAQVDTTTTRRFGGTGLGLALSKRLAKALGGDLELTSTEPHKGSTFVARIDPGPVALTDLASGMTLKEALASEKDSEGRLPSSGLEGLCVLVVDDSSENRDLVACYLENAGAEVVSAADGVEGVEKATARSFDAILMDVQMPRMDGYQAVAKLRDVRYPAPIIAITAHAMEEERTRCRDAGFDEFLVKPIDAAMLVNVVGRMGRVVRALGPGALERDVTMAVPSPLALDLPEETPGEEGPVLDLGRLGHASERVVAIFERFVDGLPNEMELLRAAHGRGDIERVAKLAHKLKGSAGSCGFAALMRCAARLEVVAKDPRASGRTVGPELDRVGASSERSMKEFRGWLATRRVSTTGSVSPEVTI